MLRSGLVGAGGFGAHILAALRSSPMVELAGLSDRDPAAAAASAEDPCPRYSDHRRLLAETGPQAVFLAVPPAPAGELVRLAAQRRLHVWRAMPLARNLGEGLALCQAMDKAGRTFAVGLQRRYHPGYRRAKELLGRLGKVYLVQAHYLFNWGPALGWHGDRAAGGGALMDLGYHLFDLVVWLLGLPAAVYCVASGGQHPAGRARAVYDSDDSATAILHYGGKAAATVTVSRCFDPVSEGLSIYAENGSLSAGPDRCVLRDRQGKVLETFQQDEPPSAVFRRMVEAFASSVLAESPACPCSGWENMLTLAVVEAAYLSDHVGQQESPAELLAHLGLTAKDCLKCSPPETPPRQAPEERPLP